MLRMLLFDGSGEGGFVCDGVVVAMAGCGCVVQVQVAGGIPAGEVEISLSHGDAAADAAAADAAGGAGDVAERLSFCKEADPPPPPRLIDEMMMMNVKRCVVCMDRWHYVGIAAW